MFRNLSLHGFEGFGVGGSQAVVSSWQGSLLVRSTDSVGSVGSVRRRVEMALLVC